ncbi:MAG: hypothetical protein Q9173_005928 [Seirophora scorigena]
MTNPAGRIVVIRVRRVGGANDFVDGGGTLFDPGVDHSVAMCTMMPPLLHQPPAPGAPSFLPPRTRTCFFRPSAQGRTSRRDDA